MKKIYPQSLFQNKNSFLNAFKLKISSIIVLLVLLSTTTAKSQQVYTVVEGEYPISLQGVNPFATIVKNQRTQYLYVSDYLQNLNAPSGFITAVSLKITQVALPESVKPENLQIKMGLTGLVSLPDNLLPNLPVHYSIASENITTTGWYTFTLDTPFYWDGYSNIAVEFCRTNTITGSSFEIEADLGLIDEYRSAGLVNNTENSNGCTLTGITGVSLANRRLLPSMRFTMTDPCTTNPDSGTVVVSAGNDYCQAPFTLSVIDDSVQSGLSYQWQYNFNNDGNFSNIDGATGPTLTTTQEFATYYRRGIMCDALGVIIYPPALLVSGPGCICGPTVTTTDETGITNVTFATISTDSESTPFYTDFRNVQINVQRDANVILSAKVSTTTAAVYTKAWIDWNQDGVFGEVESYNLGMLNTGVNVSSGAIASVNVPTDAVLGQTVMRVRTASVSGISLLEPCGNALNGEAEDYTIVVEPSLGLTDLESQENSIIVFGKDNVANVRSTIYDICAIKIFDLSGRLLFSSSELSEKEVAIALPKVPSQILIMEIKTITGLSVNRKISINN